jgi:hypothetical protein
VQRVAPAVGVGLLAGVVCLAGCGSSSPSNPSPQEPGTITITASGVTPTEVRIPRFGRVTFVNNDVRAHAMSSDPVQTHTDCPPINDVGTIDPGQSRATGTLSIPRVCGFHDHIRETDPTFKGRIIVE